MQLAGEACAPGDALEWTLAVLGGRAPPVMLLKVLGVLEDPPVEAAVMDALHTRVTQQRFVEDAQGCLDFLTEEARQACYTGIPPAVRQYLHRRVADAIHASAPTASATAEVVGYHLVKAGQPELAVDHVVTAAEAAVAVWAPEKALSLVQRGLEALAGTSGVEPRELVGKAALVHAARAVRLNLIRLQVLRQQGQNRQFLDEALATREVIAGSLYRHLASDVEAACAEAALACRRLPEAATHAAAALDLAREAADENREGDCALLKYRAAAAAGDDARRDLLADALRLSRRGGMRTRRVPPLLEAAALHLAEGRPALAVTAARRAAAWADPRQQRREQLAARRLMAGAWLAAGERERAGRALLDHVADAELGGFLQECAEGLLELGRYHRLGLESQFVDTALNRALGLARELGFPSLLAPATGMRVESGALAAVKSHTLAAWLRQDLPERLAELREVASADADGWWSFTLAFFERLPAVARGDRDAAMEAQERLEATVAQHGRRVFERQSDALVLAEACRLAGQRELAVGLARELVQEESGLVGELHHLALQIISG